jgi:hypothetical protein
MATSQEAHVLNERIKALAADLGLPVQRIRNRLGFQRVLARLAQSQDWILKGGFSLETRLSLRARATKDLDVLHLGAAQPDADSVQDLVDNALDQNLGDGFTFHTRPPKSIRVEDSGSPSWRIGVDAFYFNSPFSSITIDIVLSASTSTRDTEPLVVTPTLIGAPFTMPALDLERHAAEKFHACTRIYAHDRPSSRVKDLVDLIVLHEYEDLNRADLDDAIRRVFMERNHCEPPDTLPNLPREWTITYPPLAEETGLSITDAATAWQIATKIYTLALSMKDHE